MNKVELLGHLTKDVEIRYTQSNTPVASFTLAVNRRFAKEGEQQADFINIVAWNKTAEFCGKYFKKGSQIALVGRIQTRNWEDDNGQKHYATEVVAEEVYFADSKKDVIEDNGEPTDVTNDVYGDTMVASGDDLPF